MRICIFLLLIPFQILAQDAQLEKFVDSLVGPFNKPDVPGSMVLIAQDGKPLVKKAYGLASLEFNIPLNTNHAFGIGSISKQFTAVAILQLAQQGKLNLEDDVRKYLPGMNTQGHLITIRHLLSHTSGISSSERKGFTTFGLENGVAAHPDRFISYIMSEKLLFAPGTNWSYNNVAYRMNAIIVERVSGQKFADYMREHVFLPAGMKNTFIGSDLVPLNNVAVSYLRGYEGKWRNENSRRSYWDWAKGSGNVVSTLDDMMNWDIALREGKVLSDEWLQKAWAPQVLKNGLKVDYGLGWDLSNEKGIRIINHSGAFYAYSAQSVHIPEKKLYILYVNCFGGEPSTIPKRIMSRMLDIPFPKPVPVAGIDLSEYVGTYEVPHASVRLSSQISDRPVYATLTTAGDTLYIQYTARERSFLRPAGKDQFIPARAQEPVYVFNRDASGRVVSMQVKTFLIGPPMSEEKNLRGPVVKRDPVKIIASLKPEILKSYSGIYYRATGDQYLFVETDGTRMYAYEMTPAAKYELLPVSETRFVRKGIEDISISFGKDKQGLMVLTLTGNRTTQFNKIADQ